MTVLSSSANTPSRASASVASAHCDSCIGLFDSVEPTCADDLLLYFPYEDHYNDVTCHHAIATQYGTDVYRKHDAARNGNVACFGGAAHFEVNWIDQSRCTVKMIQIMRGRIYCMYSARCCIVIPVVCCVM